MAEESKLPTFECLGVDFGTVTPQQAIGDCPFCDKGNHFFVNPVTGQWDCKVCGESGNVITFLSKISKKAHSETHTIDWKRLEKVRGLPTNAFKRYGVGWSGHEWWIPIPSEKGTVRDIRRWNGSRTASTKGCHNQLFGLQELYKAPRGSRVWLCEGEWDAIAMRWLLDQLGLFKDVVVGVPGATIFKKDWIAFFGGMHVILLFDNDKAGDDGSEKAGGLLAAVAKVVEYLCWPDSRPTGWDTRDFILESLKEKIGAEEMLKAILSLVHRKHRRDASSLPEKGRPAESSGGDDDRPRPSFPEIVATFKKWAHVTKDYETGLAIALAISLTNEIPGDPLWLYLIAPAGGGKTMILTGLRSSSRTIYKSSLKPAELVSGFNVHPDPSLLPQLNGKTAIFKDGTELLDMHPDARREVYAILRGAYDGYVNRGYGNGVKRDYEVHFNMIVGVTPAIHRENTTSMGERFLKFQMKETREGTRDKLRSAIRSIGREVKMEQEMQDVISRFLRDGIKDEDLVPVPHDMEERIINLALVLSMLRAQVDREGADRDLRYRPVPEVGTRIAKQLTKLGQALAFVYDKDVIDEELFTILERVTMDSAIGFHFEIAKALRAAGETGMAREDLCRLIHLPTMTTLRRLEDMEHLGIVQKNQIGRPSNSPGPIPIRWIMRKDFMEMWDMAFQNQMARRSMTGRSGSSTPATRKPRLRGTTRSR